jgi:hypothetical protein
VINKKACLRQRIAVPMAKTGIIYWLITAGAGYATV